jgi:hypothetical protein
MKTKTTRTSRYLFGILLVILTICSTGFAITLFDTGLGQITSSDPTQQGRLTRSVHNQNDWFDGTPPFPGVINAGTTYHYHTYTIPASSLATTPFVQFTVDDPTANLFVSAYLDNYDPNNKATNYFGDEGFSGNPEFSLQGGPTDTGYFQVHVPAGHSLVVLVNETPAAVPQSFRLLAEGFTDTQFDNPSTPTPTPTPKPTAPAISISVAPASIKEGNSATFTFTATPTAHSTFTVAYQMSGTATNGPDYTVSPASSVTFGVNQASAHVTLTSKVDNLNEGSETATMKILPGNGYTVGSPSQVSVLIKDNK